MTRSSLSSDADRPLTLALHPGALGDVLLALPALRALRQAHAGAALALAAQPRIADVLVALGEIDQGLDFDGLGLDALFVGGPLRDASPLGSARHVVSWFGAGDPVFVRALTALVPGSRVASSTAPGVLVWRHLLRTVDEAAAPAREPVRVSSGLRKRARAALRDAGWTGAPPLVILHPGAGSRAKQWPVEGFASIADRATAQEYVVAVHEGPADRAAVEALLGRVGRPVIRFRDPALPVLAGALAEAALYVGNDSGVSHLAAAVGAPAVILFTPLLLAWQPWSPTPRVVEVTATSLEPRDVAAVAAAVADALATR
jgi:ADP-heptose:LPS heptosyltransferase